MWPSKKNEEIPSTSSTPESPVTVRDLRPLSTAPRAVDGTSRLGKSLAFQGELKGTEDLTLDGQFQGKIELGDHSVVIGPHGEVRADIRAREIVIEGSVHGNLRARDRLQIRKTGSVVGDLVAARIVIEDGAYFKGSIDIERGEEKAARADATAAESYRVAASPLAANSKEKLQ